MASTFSRLNFKTIAGGVLFTLGLTLDFITGNPFSLGPLQQFMMITGAIVVVIGCIKPRTSTTLVNQKIRTSFHIITAVMLVISFFIILWILDLPYQLNGPSVACSLIAILLIFAGLSKNSYLNKVTTGICVLLVSAMLFIFASEGFFRLIKFDFSRGQRWDWSKLPPYYREPTVPDGTVFFRRPGPEKWTGRVREAGLRQNAGEEEFKILPNPYKDEPVVTAEYNNLGFRNPAGLNDWEIAIAGDSFTELGYLPYEKLFTTILGKRLNKSVLNLGVSSTGPLTQLNYLQEYGISKSTHDVVIVFYEGNDVGDMDMEYRAIKHLEKTGKREYREIKAQSSILLAFYGTLEFLRHKVHPPKKTMAQMMTAYFTTPEGKVPLTLNYTPPGRKDLNPESVEQFNYFFSQYQKFGKDKNLTTWFAYMPGKERVLHGEMELVPDANEKFKNWQPTDLPEYTAELCHLYGIRYINLTPALLKETREKHVLVYNTLYDTHLNERGSEIVAEELAKNLSR